MLNWIPSFLIDINTENMLDSFTSPVWASTLNSQTFAQGVKLHILKQN